MTGSSLQQEKAAGDAASVRELMELFAARSRDARRGLANALAGYTATAFLYDTDLDARILALAHSFRDGVPLGPRTFNRR